jgi:oligopeptide transport system substrate-binding protein
LSLAIDREVIAHRVMRAGERPAYSYIPPNMPNYRSASLNFQTTPTVTRLKKARELLRACGFDSRNSLAFEFSFPNQTDTRLVAVALQEMWREIGVDARLLPAETQIHYSAMRRQNFSVAWSGWYADFRDAKNYLFIWQSTGGDMNVGKYSNPHFDALVDRSDFERDVAVRGRMLAEAEQMLLDDAALAPVYFNVSRNLVSPQVQGWRPNDLDVHRSRYLRLNRKAGIA